MSDYMNPKTDTVPNSGLSTLLLIFAGISFFIAFFLWVEDEESILIIGSVVGGFQLFITAYVIQALKNMEFYLKGIYEK